MAKQTRRAVDRDTKRRGETVIPDYEREAPRPAFRAPPPLEPQTDAQRHYMKAIKSSKLTFGTGPAGTGKTYVAGALAAELLTSKRVEKIIITRPGVEAGERFGFLPGEIEDKYAVYIEPFMDVLTERMGKGHVEYCMRTGKIKGAPLAFMRGSTFKNAVVIFDEAQNATPTQMKMFLTRIGEDCTIVVNGDINQKDIPGPSGLAHAVKLIRSVPGVRVVEFTRADIVRSGLVQLVVEKYEQEAEALALAA
jgi:phosphate starvation-inducible PhoH-like protein